MKSLAILLLCTISHLALSQKVSRDEVVRFWKSNMQAIMDLDKSHIMAHTNYPVEGTWGYLIDLKGVPEEWIESDFNNNIETIFSEKFRQSLKSKTFNDLIHHSNEEGETVLIINLVQTNLELSTGKMVESTIILFFKKFDSDWKLYMIEYVGD